MEYADKINLALKNCKGTTIGVTGYKGKTITSNLIYKILKKQGFKCFINILEPSKLKDINKEDYLILELSSKQLVKVEASPNIAVITNTNSNYLGIHKTYEEYIEATNNIFKYQNSSDLLILNYDDKLTGEFAKKANGKVANFSTKVKLDDGVILDNKIIKTCDNGLRRHIINTKHIKLDKFYNIENICAAIAVTSNLASIELQADVIKKFE